MAVIVYLFLSCALGGAGAILAKQAADTGSNLYLALALAIYSSATLSLLPVLKSAGLGWAMVSSSALHLVCMTVAGWLLFGERISTYQALGMMFAICALVCMAIPAAQHAEVIS